MSPRAVRPKKRWLKLGKKLAPWVLAALLGVGAAKYAPKAINPMRNPIKTVGAVAGVWGGIQLAAWGGKKLRVDPKTLRVVKFGAAVAGGVTGWQYPVVMTGTVLLANKKTRKVIFKWTKKGWQVYIKPQLEKGREKLKEKSKKRKT